ncbi:MAG: hypothetical protein GXP43_03035, partial [bacterium]|nr:hypothetical protein [bacterium]
MNTFEKVKIDVLRWPMVKLGTINVILLFIIVYLSIGFWEALIASLIYSTAPTFVISSRMPLAENIFVTMSLISLILFWLVNKIKRSKIKTLLIFSLFLLGTAAPLIKQTGIFIPVALAFLFFSLKDFKNSFLMVMSLILSQAIWFSYGCYYNCQLFLDLQSLFSGRKLLYPVNILRLFDTFRIAEKPMQMDGWLIWGWISIIFLSFIT